MNRPSELAALLRDVVPIDAPADELGPDPESTRIDDPDRLSWPIVCGDGREWHFAGPSIMVGPEFEETRDGDRITRRIVMGTRIGYPLAIRRALADAMVALDRAASEGGDIPFPEVATLAVMTVRKCHAISEEEAAALLFMPAPDVARFASQLLRVALGYAPDDPANDNPSIVSCDPAD